MYKIALLSLALAAPIVARAQSSYPGSQTVAPSTQLFVKLGAIIPQSDALDGYDNGLALEAGVGFQLSPYVGVDVGIGRFAMSVSDSGFDPILGFVTVEEEVSAIPLTASLRLTAPAGGLDLYGLVGGGLYFMSISDDVSTDFDSVSVSDDDTSFGFHLGAGFAARLSPQVSLGAEVKYFMTSADFYGVEGDLDSLIIAGSFGYRF